MRVKNDRGRNREGKKRNVSDEKESKIIEGENVAGEKKENEDELC